MLAFSCSGQQSNDRQLIEKSVHNFYDWYIGTINSGKYFDLFKQSEREDGMTKLDTEIYFEKLKSFGTVSDEFILSERLRLKKCDELLSTVTWTKYKESDGFDYDDKCELNFYYWIFSQEPVEGIKIKRVTVDKNVSTVELTFFITQDGKQIDMASAYDIHITLNKQNGMWFLRTIERK
jgi:hypothetical protein